MLEVVLKQAYLLQQSKLILLQETHLSPKLDNAMMLGDQGLQMQGEGYRHILDIGLRSSWPSGNASTQPDSTDQSAFQNLSKHVSWSTFFVTTPGSWCRERAAGYYAELAWAAGEMVVELPYLLLQTCLYSVITYFMICFEINAGENPVCTLHAIPVRPSLQHSPALLQDPCQGSGFGDCTLRHGTCPHDAGLFWLAGDDARVYAAPLTA